jgi:long-chain acyl-CoA synthetase
VRLRTVVADLEAAADRDPEKTAVIAGERRLAYGELRDRAAGVAAGLAKLGVERGDRVAMVMTNGVDAAVAIEGILRAGAALTPLNPTMKRDKVAYVLTDTAAAAVLCDAEHSELVSSAAERAGGMPVVGDLEGLARAGSPPPPPPLETDLAAVLYTSGSTGEPKGVTLGHGNLAFATDAICDYLEMSADDRILCLLQLSFGYGLVQLLGAVRSGATLVLERGITVPGRIVQALEEQRITGLPGVPTIFQVLTSLRGLAERELPALRFLTNAGASMPVATVEAVRRTFPGARLFLMYGLTECIRVSYLPPDQLERRPTSSGIPMAGTDAWVDDGEGGVAAADQVGELLVRGPHVMYGFGNRPDATAERLRPGRWPGERVLATGDLFRRDADGYLHWMGRTDDLIKCRGEKVYPREVEEVLHGIAGVREAAVVGVPDPLLGHAVEAHVAADSGHDLDERALRRACAEALEEHKVPRRVSFHDSLPRNPRGKVDRRALVTQAGGDGSDGGK